MGFVFINKSIYSNATDVDNLIRYIVYPTKCANMICRTSEIISINPMLDVDTIVKQFLTIQSAYNGKYIRRVYHIYFSFDSVLDPMTLSAAESIGLAFMKLYPGYQSMFSVHEDTKHLHFHMVINNIPRIPGGETLSHYLNKLDLETLADMILEDYTHYYFTHKASKVPNAEHMAMDAFYRFISIYYKKQ